MIATLLALKKLFRPRPPAPAHAELEHAHWDADTRTWWRHLEPTTQEDAA